MRKLRIQGPHTVAVAEAPEPNGKAGEIRLRTRYVGICGSDYLKYIGKHPDAHYPATPGHEFTAEVMDDDSHLSRFRGGSRVVVNPNLPCRSCRFCLSGHSYLCEKLATIGAKGLDGAMQTILWMPHANLVVIEDQANEMNTVLTEPLAVAIHGCGMVKRGRILAIGLGTVGMLAISYLGSSTDAEIDIVELTLAGLKLPSGPRVIRLMSLSEFQSEKSELVGKYDVVLLMCPYDGRTMQAAVDVACRGGRIVCVGLPLQMITLDFNVLLNKEVEILQSFKYSETDFRTAYEFLAAHDLTDCIPFRIFDLDDAAEAFRFKDEHPRTKVVLRC